MRTSVIKLRGILLILVTVSLWGFAAQAGEYWISPSNSLSYLQNNTAPANQGTLESPYYGHFDQIISSIPSNSIIHLSPGVYWSRGDVGQTTNFGLRFKIGQKVRGSGIDTTVLRMTNDPNSSNFMAIIYTTNSSVEVSDLTAEYSTAPSASAISNGVGNGLSLFGSDSKIDRVKVTGLWGDWTGSASTSRESFGLLVGTNSTDKGGRIADCEVSGPFYGDYHSAILLAGEGAVRNNRVIFSEDAGPTGKGLTFAYANHVSIVGNYQYGGQSGVFSDTGSCTNVIAVGNQFRLTAFPIHLGIANSTQQWHDIYFVKNLIEADCDNSWMSSISASSNATITNIVIADNVTIPYRQSTNRTTALLIHQGTGGHVTGLRIFRNLWPTNTVHSLLYTYPITMNDNLDVEGIPHHVNPETDDNYNETNAVAAMPTVVYTLGGTWPPNNQLERVNQSVVVVTGGSGSGTLKLPVVRNSNDWQWWGRQITIINSSTNGTVTISASNTSLERIKKNDGTITSSMTLNATNPPARFVSGQDGTWHQL